MILTIIGAMQLTIKGEKIVDEEIKFLKERIEFLEALLELNSLSLEKAMETNKKLIDYIRNKE